MTLENDLQRCTPCIWQNGAATQLPLPEGRTDGYTFTISDSGYVAGYAYNAGQEYGDTACLWKDGVLVSLADAEGSFVSCVRDVNDAGQAVGYKDWSAVLWDDGNCYKINDLLINNNRYVSDAICIDNRGQIAAERGAFLWTSTTLLLVPGVEVKIDIMPDDATNMIWLNNNRPVTVAVTGSEAFAVSSIAPESVRFAGSRPSHWLVRDVDGDRFLDMVLWFAKDSLQIDPYVDYRQDLSGRTTCGGAFAGVDFVNYLYRTKPGKK
jgi:hypothetical protein